MDFVSVTVSVNGLDYDRDRRRFSFAIKLWTYLFRLVNEVGVSTWRRNLIS